MRDAKAYCRENNIPPPKFILTYSWNFLNSDNVIGIGSTYSDQHFLAVYKKDTGKEFPYPGDGTSLWSFAHEFAHYLQQALGKLYYDPNQNLIYYKNANAYPNGKPLNLVDYYSIPLEKEAVIFADTYMRTKKFEFFFE